MNQLTYGQKIRIPAPFVRSISFEKIRSGSLSARQQSKENIKINSDPQNNNLQKLMSKKLQRNQKCSEGVKLKERNGNIRDNQHITEMKKKLEDKQMKQCTFKPKINSTSFKNRTIGEFVNQQYAFEKKTKSKVDQMREMISAKMQKQNTFRPNLIQHNNDRVADGRVYNRLYQDSKKRIQQENTLTQITERQNSKNKSKQKLSTVSRNGSIKSIDSSAVQKKNNIRQQVDSSDFNQRSPLTTQISKVLKPYNQEGNLKTDRSPISRQNSTKSLKTQKGLKVTKYMNVQQLCDKKLHDKNSLRIQSETEKNCQKTNIKNKQIYVQKILREMTNILLNEKINKTVLSYMQVGHILEKMNFIDEQDNVENRKYLFEIWQMLQGDIYETVPLVNLIKIVFCLLGCHEKDIIQPGLKLYFQSHELSERVLILTEKDSKKIKLNFEQFYLNRLKKGEYAFQCSRRQQYSFKPYISKTSIEMASKYRQKIIQQSQQLINNKLIDYRVGEDGMIDHIDLLYLGEKRKQLKMKIKREECEKQKKRIEDEIMGTQNKDKASEISNCSKQKYRNSSMNNSEKNIQESSINRINSLYSMGKFSLRQKQNAVNDEPLPKECTFRPNVYKPRSNSIKNLSRGSPQSQPSIIGNNHSQSQNSTSSCQIKKQVKDFDKSIFRMYEGRRMREETLHCHEETIQILGNKDTESPLVYLNVNMEGYQQTKVPIYKTDNMKSITHKVRILMGISIEDEDKLQQILKLQIMPALNDIGIMVSRQQY